MSPKNKKRPRSVSVPFVKEPRTLVDVDGIDQTLFRWRANNAYVDYDHAEWGWGDLSCRQFFDILTKRLHDYEAMTWAHLAQRNSCHPMPVENISRPAKKRLLQVCGDKVDCLYQVDITPTCRLFGYRDRGIFYLIWHDPKHTVYPV